MVNLIWADLQIPVKLQINKVYQLPKKHIESVVNPLFQSSFEKSNEGKPFSPFQSSESTLKRQQWKNDFKSTNVMTKKMPLLNLNKVEKTNFHEEFMNTWKEF